jgi:hypothetical protein
VTLAVIVGILRELYERAVMRNRAESPSCNNAKVLSARSNARAAQKVPIEAVSSAF